VTTFRDGVQWLDARRDFKSFCAYHHRGQLSFAAWLSSVVAARSFATFALDDLHPFLRSYRVRPQQIHGFARRVIGRSDEGGR
jgi:hypothetical protein